MLELRGVTKRYPGVPAVQNVSFTARAGEVTGYLGPNGSGKSTTMKMITGLIDMTSGEIVFNGESIERDAAEGAPGGGTPPQSRRAAAGRAVFWARRRHSPGATKSDSGAGRTRQ